MERLTKHHFKKQDGFYMTCSEHCSKEDFSCEDCGELDKLVDRLGTIEDILGDDYDLDRLRELLEADRDGRCVILPCKDWLEIVFGEQEIFFAIDDDYEEEKVREITVRSEDRFNWYNGWETVALNGIDENGLNFEFLPEEIGRNIFLTREAAQAALERMKSNG